jgi:transposase
MSESAQPLESLGKKELIALLENQRRALAEREQKTTSLEQKNQRLAQRIHYLEEQLRLALSHRYGQRSERRAEDDPQADLFNEAEELVATEPDSAAGSTEVRGHVRRRTSGRQALPENLPREVIEHDIDDADKVCACGCHKQRIGEEVSENLEYIPARLYVARHVRHKYACPQCEAGVQVARKPASLIPGSNAGNHLLAFILVAKYQDALPLYRLSRIFERQGIDLPRNTLARWVIQCSEALTPLLGRMDAAMREVPVILMDETTLQVNREPGREAASTSYMWIRRGLSPPDASHPRGRDVTLYHYSPTRSSEVALSLLSGYRGALMTDGYAGYRAAVARYGLVHATCWAHARRKFVEAEKALPRGKTSPAITAILNRIRKLYAIEKRLAGASPEQRQAARERQARPILEQLRTHLEKKSVQVTPKSKFGDAIGYTLKHWDTLTTYVNNGSLPIDNNGAENGIRPFVIGRKNWLFADTVKGAQASARIYSVIETAKANGHEPYAYLSRLFDRLPQADSDDALDALLPWNLTPAA